MTPVALTQRIGEEVVPYASKHSLTALHGLVVDLDQLDLTLNRLARWTSH